VPPQYVKWWSTFELVVAQFYRNLGSVKVQQNVNLAGNEVDVYVEERTPSGQHVRIAVECKFYQRRVPKDAVVRFGTVAKFLRDAALIDKAVLVAYLGFTPDAFSAAEAIGIELRTFADLEAQIEHLAHGAVSKIIRAAERRPVPDCFPDLVFVIMPFKEDLQDLYFYGIRGAAERAGLKCSRGDELVHDSSIINEVKAHIRGARVIVAEVSDHNPNVFYEVGWAHALERQTILVARHGTQLPFDIAHINTILYTSIKDLDDRLSARFAGLGRSNPGVRFSLKGPRFLL
jgi:hypothetical protein